MLRPQSIPISLVESFFSGYRHRGFHPSTILTEIGLPADLLDSPSGSFPIAKLGDLLSAISIDLQDETLGFLSRPTRIGGLEMSIHAIISSRTLREALLRYQAFWKLMHDDFGASLETHGEEARMELSYRVDESLDCSSFITWIMFVTLRVAVWLIDKPILLDRLYFTFPEPRDLSDYREMFPTSLYFDHSENITVFNKRFLDMPVVQTPEGAPDFVKILPHLMTVRRADHSLTGRIRRMLMGEDNVDALPLKTIADQLNKSPDTIRRHLNNEGNSFKEIKESVRRDLAIQQLERSDVPINQIAHRLGFSEPSAFNRAFKNWTGITPGDYRRKNA